MSKSELFEKIANMMAYSVPDEQIAIVCRMTGDQLQKVKSLPAFEQVLASVEFENIDRQKTLNDGWDTLEETALGKLLTAMDVMQDPEFNLKVAAVANKAQRRGGRLNRPIEGNLGSRAVINLNQTFVTRLQNPESTVAGKTIATVDSGNKKDHNFMAPSAVENLLRLRKDDDEVGSLIRDLPAFAL